MQKYTLQQLLESISRIPVGRPFKIYGHHSEWRKVHENTQSYALKSDLNDCIRIDK
mgnify:CR=1 FL=1